VAIVIGVPTETYPDERRVALTPKSCDALTKIGATVIIQEGAGIAAGFPDSLYEAKGARVAPRNEVFRDAQILAMVRTLGANPDAGRADLPHFRPGQLVVGLGEPLTALREDADMAETGASLLALELIPRITRAQAMDVLSSMATISGYHAVLIGAMALPKIFPMLMTAAGTLTAAKVFVLGVGVAGLQAITFAKRLGAVVSAYDVRAVVKEQVESVGAKFVTLDVESAEGQGGYAKAMDEAFYRRQRELMTAVLHQQDVVIATAAVPGRKAPILVTQEMVEGMTPGSVIVDIAAERGGNCALTRPGEVVVHNGVAIHGPVNLPSSHPNHASLMFGSNIAALLKLVIKDGALQLDLNDEIIRESLVTHEKKVVQPRVCELLEQASQVPAGEEGVHS
jgi:proton-translocating NAD(P)+ transhydrogenase subunit alpha